MRVYNLDPLEDSRWDDLVASHPEASPFHLTGWLKALRTTYGYRPFVLTSTPPGKPLADGVALCEVKSWITGSRLVSLPFSDHAQPLLSGTDQLRDLLQGVTTAFSCSSWRYLEIRPTDHGAYAATGFAPSQSFWLHTLDLTPPLEKVFKSLHRDCIQRRILHASRAGLSYERGTHDKLLDDFYQLLLLTRRRHHVVAQPLAWFQNLRASMGSALEIRMLRKDDAAIAAILTLKHRNTVTYKYGCSDQRFHHFAPMPYLFWHLIEESKSAGVETMDLGRTEPDNKGLLHFKERLAASGRQIAYLRYPQNSAKEPGVVRSLLPRFGRILSCLPEGVSSFTGTVMYRHFA